MELLLYTLYYNLLMELLLYTLYYNLLMELLLHTLYYNFLMELLLYTLYYNQPVTYYYVGMQTSSWYGRRLKNTISISQSLTNFSQKLM